MGGGDEKHHSEEGRRTRGVGLTSSRAQGAVRREQAAAAARPEQQPRAQNSSRERAQGEGERAHREICRAQGIRTQRNLPHAGERARTQGSPKRA
jgi:hypothetical protein